MLTYRTGVAGSSAGGIAVAKYLTAETLRPENEALAQYYAGEAAPDQTMTGMEALGKAIAAGDVEFSAALDSLTRAHMRLYGMPDDVEGLDERMTGQLLSAADRAEKLEAIAAEGGTVAGLRPDLNSELAKRLGIDTSRPPTVEEIAYLLAGRRADGEAIEGKQIQKPMRSVAEVFGLDKKRLPSAEAVAHVLAGRRADGEAPRDAGGQALPNEVVQGARKRFLAAYGMPSGQEPTAEQVGHMQAGRTVAGLAANPGDGLWKLNAKKQPIAFYDMTWKADKSVSVAWALASTEAERAVIKQAHDDAVAYAMNHAEKVLGFARLGKGGERVEPGQVAYLTFNHYTARPTAEIKRVDAEGQEYTDFQNVPMRVADPHLHTHATLLNAVYTAGGSIGAIDGDLLAGKVKEMGGVYQAALARNLRAHGIQTELDKETGAARIVAIPERVRRHFSKRSQDGLEAARTWAKEQGLDWDAMTPERKCAALSRGVEETRHAKSKRDGASDFAEWRNQALDEIGYRHRSVLRPNEIARELTPEMRQGLAYKVSLDLIEDALSRNAKLSAQDFREFAVRGLVQAGIGDDPERDIKAVMQMYRTHGVKQDRETVGIIFGKDVPVRGKERWSVTTEAHEAGELRVVELAKQFAADRSNALPAASLEKAKRDFLVSRPHIDPDGASWREQSAAIDALGTGPRLGVAIGAAGVGKTTLLTPIVAAAKAEGRDVHGLAIAWKQATALGDTGIERKNLAAIAAFIHPSRGEKHEQLSKKSIVILDELSQVGRVQMLKLLELQQKHGFTLLAVGDPKQSQSVEAGGVIDLLKDAMGNAMPEVLISNRQRSGREKEIASLFREGGESTAKALAMKREDRTAELVAGGRDATIARVATLWRERIEARGTDPNFRLTISAPTNRDAHAIGLAIREQKRNMGELGTDKFTVSVELRGESGERPIALAAGDRVRLFNRVWIDKAHFGSNGDTLTVLDANKKGLTARNEVGREAFIAWDQLRKGDREGPIRLAYGYASTVDASQGATSDEHIDALPDGSRVTHGLKGYVAESRHRDTTWMVVNEAAERKQIASRIPLGEYRPIGEGDVWKNVAANLSRQPIKASALDFLKQGSSIQRGTQMALPASLEQAERRERAGEERATIRHRLERVRAEMSSAIRQTLSQMRDIQQHVAEIAHAQKLAREQHGQQMRG